MSGTPPPKEAVVLLSGGLDSATTLAMARATGFTTHALSVDYGQRHNAELVAAAKVAEHLGATSHRVVVMDLTTIGGSALTDADIAVPVDRDQAAMDADGVPVTYVPARNTVLLALALGLAETLGARDIFCGVNAVDYSGYPDCRPEFIRAFEDLAQLATKAGVEGQRVRIAAPLIKMSKAEIVRVGTDLGVDYGLTVSCYQADAEGLACGRCDACHLRRQGFSAAGLEDPTRYVSAA